MSEADDIERDMQALRNKIDRQAARITELEAANARLREIANWSISRIQAVSDEREPWRYTPDSLFGKRIAGIRAELEDE